MATVAPSALNQMYALIDRLDSERRGGIVGDRNHGSGYHLSRQDNRPSDYSVQAPADKRGPSNAASAIDITLSDAEMRSVSKRLKVACINGDDRIEPLREFIGTVDSRNVCGYNRYRTGRATGWYASGYSDKSHLWHVHLSFFRDYCDDLNSVRGVAEVVCGLNPGALGWKAPAVKGSTATKPKPSEPKPPVGPNGQKTYVMYATKTVKGYAANKVGAVRWVRKAGTRLRGYPIRRTDGRYLRTLYGTDYPMDSLSHSKPGATHKPKKK